MKTYVTADTRLPFDIAYLRYGDTPGVVGPYNGERVKDTRINHWMLKNNTDDFLLMPPVAIGFVERCQSFLTHRGMEDIWRKRYAYLTIDTKTVESGEAQRTVGWHIDGMQGDEVLIKVPPDITFVWCNDLPTRFSSSDLNLTDLNTSKDNVFAAMEKRIQLKDTFFIDPGIIYYITAYMPHTGEIARRQIVNRVFMRLGFSLTPITSVRMTVNPRIVYNYPIHKTSGEIPAHLKKETNAIYNG